MMKYVFMIFIYIFCIYPLQWVGIITSKCVRMIFRYNFSNLPITSALHDHDQICVHDFQI